MPRVLVVTDDTTQQVLMDERVDPCHLDGPSALQLLERMNWSIHDADRREQTFRETTTPQPHTQVGAS